MQDKRTVEFVLGLIGGIFGIISGVAAIGLGGLGVAVGATGSTTVGGLGILAILFSILGIVGAVVVRTKGKLGGIFMTIAAICGFICISYFYILPGVLLIIPGLMGLIKKSQSDKKA
ncbi:DUF4064 domain-containing protein [Clostridium felsineum]|uniref:DUF4064 domain-containing protein n=1 Tax=Clostridium felsineum TaxID=36839 RepID=UPI00098CD2A0|nr:DUF4064 domain-containing protein [Clostridium felsineum]URZ01897.1 hypothetical protein CLAUR_018940 [Clostridium felsineum]